MKTALALLLVGFLAVAAFAAAQPDPQAMANDTVQKGASAVDGLVGGATEKVKDASPVAAKKTSGLGNAANAIGRFFAAVADTAVTSVVAVGKVFSAAGLALASGIATVTTAAVQVAVAGLAALGAALAVLLAAAGTGLAALAAAMAAGMGALLGLYANLVGALRPSAMNPDA